METAAVLRKDAADRIWSALNEAHSVRQFIEEASGIVSDRANLLALPFETSPLAELETRADRARSETQNAIALYEALGAMPRVAAADERLWTYLALGPCRQYMESRWPLEATRSWKGRAQARWLIKSPTYGTLIRHGIARLWWLAELTYDPDLRNPLSADKDDPWAYLRVALGNEDRIIAIFDRDTALNSSVRFALLEYCQRHNASESDLRALMKEVTLAAGYQDLSAVDQTQLVPLIEDLRPARAAHQ